MSKGIETLKKFHEAWNNKDIDAIGDLLTDDTLYEGPLFTWKSKEEYLKGIEPILPGFEEIKVRQQMENGNTIFTIEDITANFPEGPITVHVAEVTEIRGDKIAKSKTYFDPRPIEKYCAPAQT
jgi:ketosteroid isomerase-like protein